MIKVFFYNDDGKSLLDVEFYEDNQADEVLEDVQDHGPEFACIEYDSRDFEGHDRHKAVCRLLRDSISRVMDAELAALDVELRHMPAHPFSEDFEQKMAKIIKGA